ncbi:MAG: bifunctional (p)ppGpp synthetase/guanosine-3',5'-bis(diphosphate) 3'-pyrophosphohydrolase [Actinobacteria bacterium]|nr:bifunctional (p)ppGpp synthetase/guanosine-3',5'-bis(diphosphate) 3'-pyrophosphohydrolase [Actinomycetota bacterium]NBY15799.1 bifunctional (p)ppGpp synthetase/guanosine-3',5'-bis(diphosphate) 3'-pyrophosphohydrolase [Actinomycetota bacterium]
MTETQIPQSRLSQAFAFAAWIHQDQYRKQAEDEKHKPAIKYLTHLADVLGIVIQGHGDEDQQIAALLHDALEDQPITPAGQVTAVEIQRLFGDRVLELVKDCTDGDTGIERTKDNWQERKEIHIAHMRAKAATDPAFLLVSVADKLSNSLAITNDVENEGVIVWDRFNASAKQTSWYYGEVLAVYTEYLGKENALVQRLSRQVKRLQELVAQVSSK